MELLKNIKTPEDLKKLDVKDLPALCQEIREKIIAVSSENGGHLASSLGAVESIVALYYVFDFPKDKLVFDVGHQAYAHKILSDRKDLFDTIRKEGGLSGFPNIFESEYDAFSAGHAGTSLSAALGFCEARDRMKENYFVIAFVGDASFFNGENLEALFSEDKKPSRFLIVLNDNGMSISKNTNGLYKVLTKISTKKSYSRFMRLMDKMFGWNFIGRFLKRLKGAFKRSLDSYGMLDNVGVKYVGAFDGNNVKLMVNIFSNFRRNPRATLLHVKTVKGKGYEPAEEQAEKYHGVSRAFGSSDNTFSRAIGELISSAMQKDDRVVALTAGMALGTGLDGVDDKYKTRVKDVGINEEFCVTYAAGMARAGLRPIVFIYSTFLQRSYDQIICDVCLQNLPVIFMLDRAGFVGSDGVTHQGLYDLSYLSHIPNLTVFAPKDTDDLAEILEYAIALSAPVAIRYPNGKNPPFGKTAKISGDDLWEVVSDGGKDKVALCVGPRMIRLAQNAFSGKDVTIVSARAVKPLDEKFLDTIPAATVVTMEENSAIGGFGSAVTAYFAKKGYKTRVKIFAAPDEFIEHASVERQMETNGFDRETLKKAFDE